MTAFLCKIRKIKKNFMFLLVIKVYEVRLSNVTLNLCMQYQPFFHFFLEELSYLKSKLFYTYSSKNVKKSIISQCKQALNSLIELCIFKCATIRRFGLVHYDKVLKECRHVFHVLKTSSSNHVTCYQTPRYQTIRFLVSTSPKVISNFPSLSRFKFRQHVASQQLIVC